MKIVPPSGLGALLMSLGVGFGCVPAIDAAETPVNLRSCESFVALAGSTLTNVESVGTVLNGDVGVSPGSAITGFPPGIITGSFHAADSVAAQAQLDLTTAYNDAAGRTSTDIVVIGGDIADMTLAPGLYKSGTSVGVTTGNVTFDAQGDPNAVWIIQIAETLGMSPGTQMVLKGGARANNIFWQVGSSATFGTTTVVKGNVMANVAITFNTGATLEGRALARSAAVTLDSNTVAFETVLRVDIVSAGVVLLPSNRLEFRWTTGAEFGTVGFQVYRLTENRDKAVINSELITPVMIDAQGSPVEGASYSVIDPLPYAEGHVLGYLLVETEISGYTLQYGPYWYPSSSATPCVDFNFNNSAEGWTSHTLRDFTDPILSYNSNSPGTLDITATDNVWNYGWWESPPFELVFGDKAPRAGNFPITAPQPDGENVLVMRFDLVGNEPVRNMVPAIRVRTTATNSQQADVLVITSESEGGISPYAGGGTSPSVYFKPALGSHEFGLQFDMMNFSEFQDSPDATVGLDFVNICSLGHLDISNAITEAHFTFDESDEGWTAEFAPPYTQPNYEWDPTAGALRLGAVPDGGTFEFGYWGSPETGDLVFPAAGRLYFAEFTVESDQIDANVVPTLRLRINESGFRASQYLQAASTGPNYNSPTVGNPITYTVFLQPNVLSDGAYLIFSFDLLTQDSDGNSTDAVISLTELRVKSVALP